MSGSDPGALRPRPHREPHLWPRRAAGLALASLALALAVAPSASVAKPVAKPRYYFAVTEVKAEGQVSEELRAAAKDILAKDLAGRPEFTEDLGGVTGAARGDALKKRKLKGFDVTLTIMSYSEELKPPRPGGRLKQLAVGVKVSVFGTTIQDAKLAFGGDGEANIEAEIVERRRAEEATALGRDALVQAVKQAVDQAVGKLEEKPSKPFNESKRKRAK